MTLTRTLLHLPERNLHLSALVAGDAGPLVVLCHGFPGLSYSYRHQLTALAAAGYRAVALDMKGYGQSDRPLELEAYQARVVSDDLAAVLDALGAERAVFVGHDFGAKAAFCMALHHPERVAGVVSLAVPYGVQFAGAKDEPAAGGKAAAEGSAPAGNKAPADGQAPADGKKRGKRPSEGYAAIAKRHFFHMHYFQKVGPAEAELGGQPREFLTRLFHALSGKGRLLDWTRFPAEGTGYLDVLEAAPPLPWPWLSEADMDVYVSEYTRGPVEAHFIGGLSCYRVTDLDWEHDPDYGRVPIECPALFLCGERDPVLKIVTPESISGMTRRLPNLLGSHIIPGVGHFVQQEAPEATNAALLAFLRDVAPVG
jgi:pimeloyl-ACP methyl ester carboxylesterase